MNTIQAHMEYYGLLLYIQHTVFQSESSVCSGLTPLLTAYSG